MITDHRRLDYDFMEYTLLLWEGERCLSREIVSLWCVTCSIIPVKYLNVGEVEDKAWEHGEKYLGNPQQSVN